MSYEDKIQRADHPLEQEIRRVLEQVAIKGRGIKTLEPLNLKGYDRTIVPDFILWDEIIVEVHGDHDARWQTLHRTQQERKRTEAILNSNYKLLDIIIERRLVENYERKIVECILDLHGKDYKYIKLEAFDSKTSIILYSKPTKKLINYL